jgi:hypothetical protein
MHMNRNTPAVNRQRGSAMLLTLFILSILTLAGLLATTSTTTELRMAANQMHHLQAFYAAEGVAELVSEIIEQNIACPGGFTENDRRGGLVEVVTPDFWKNPRPRQLPSDGEGENPPVRDMRIPPDTPDSEPHANVLVGGARSFSRGSALQTAAGYEGVGRSLANFGAHVVYDQIVQHTGRFNTEAVVKIQWRHAVGAEGTCRP